MRISDWSSDVCSSDLAFLLGFQLASPFIAVTLIFNLGLGLLSRLMPQMQVFFIAIPLQIVIGLGIMLIALPAMLGWFITGFEERSEEHTSELQSLMRISYAVFCLKKKKQRTTK